MYSVQAVVVDFAMFILLFLLFIYYNNTTLSVVNSVQWDKMWLLEYGLH